MLKRLINETNMSHLLQESTQVQISFNATPYPFVTHDTNITLTCSGHTVHPDFVNSDDKSYMTAIQFFKNGSHILHSCEYNAFQKLTSLSCNTSLSGVTNGDYFWCITRAWKAPCNTGQITFQIESKYS